MNKAELIKAINNLQVQTGSLACLGCGYENSCCTKGCAILRAAQKTIESIPDICIGDIVYEVFCDGVSEPYIKSYLVEDVSCKTIHYAGNWVSLDYIGKFIFLSMEDAKRHIEKLKKEGV